MGWQGEVGFQLKSFGLTWFGYIGLAGYRLVRFSVGGGTSCEKFDEYNLVRLDIFIRLVCSVHFFFLGGGVELFIFG